MNPTPRSPGLVLLVVAVSAFSTAFANSSVNVALPLIGADFHLGGVGLNWVVTAFLLSSSILVMPFGKVGDRWGRQRVLLWGVILFALGSLASGLAPNAVLLWTARVVTGVGSALYAATGMAVLVAAYPADQRGKVVGISVSMVYLGLSVGPALGGVIAEFWGWRGVFVAHFAMAAAASLLMVVGLRGNDKEDEVGRFDWAGSTLFATGLLLVLIGVSALPSPLGVGLVVAGSVTLAVFWFVESKAASPILPVVLFTKNQVFAFSNVAALLSYSATFAVAFFLSLYLEVVRGLAPGVTGVVLLTQPLIQAVFSPLTGRLSDKMSPGLLASAGMALTAVGVAGLAFLDATTPLGWVVAALVLLGLGFALFSSPNTNAIMGSVEKRNLGVASATVSTMRSVGMMLSMGLGLVLLSLYLGHEAVTPATATAFLAALRWAFGASAVLCLVGIVASLARGKGPATAA